MGRFRDMGRWLADRLRPHPQEAPPPPEGLEGSPLDLARCLEMAVDHCGLMPEMGSHPPDPEHDEDPS